MALEDPGIGLQEVGVKTQLGAQTDFDMHFVDERGKPLTLGQLAGGKVPVLFVPAYYHCPRLCGLVLGAVAKSINQLELKLGADYRVAALSFDPVDTPDSARVRQSQVLGSIDLGRRPTGEPESSFWPFLTGPEGDVKAFMEQVGFKYKRDGDEFAHTAAIFVLTPEGKISQYFTGIEYKPFDLRLALVEASHGKIGSALDHVFLYCFRFDPTKGKYVWAAFNIMRIGGVATLSLLVLLIYTLWRRERSKRDHAASSSSDG